MTRKRKALIAAGLLVLAGGVALGVLAHVTLGVRPGWRPSPMDPVLAIAARMTEVEIRRLPHGPGGYYAAKVTYYTGPSSERKIEWGVADRTDGVLSADADVLMRVVPGLRFRSVLLLQSYSHLYQLGRLEPGEYRFRFYVNGTFVKEETFEVAALSG